MYNHLQALPFIIPLTKGQVAIVDVDDWMELSKHKWFAKWDKGPRSYYAVRSIFHPKGGERKDGKRRGTTEFLHRRIVGLKFGDKRQADHINGNTLDSRKDNLRVVTNRGNSENRKDQSKHGAGVYHNPKIYGKSKPYRASVHIDGKKEHIGCFATAEEAREARREFLEGSQAKG